jgi:hypothetical protein
VHCIDSLTKIPQNDQYCAKFPIKPVEYETCNLDPCPIWIADPWSPVNFRFQVNDILSIRFS